jgi:hypothetical protein
MKLFVLAVLYSASVSALQIVFSNYEGTAKCKSAQIFKEDRLLVCL